MNQNLSSNLQVNIQRMKELIPLDKSFDIISSHLKIGGNEAFFVGLNGYIEERTLQKIFVDVKEPIDASDEEALTKYMYDHVGYASVTPYKAWDELFLEMFSGTALMLINGSTTGFILDIRTYPARSVEEPDTEPVTKGAHDGFTETMLTNANLIRRRIRANTLTFEAMHVGTVSRTDISIGYLGALVDQEFLSYIRTELESIQVTSLTMGTKSLEELLLKKSFFHPLPSICTTERPDVASSYLMEGHILILVDNSPSVMILPCSIFQFTQHPDDYYNSPIVGNYFRLVRFLCLLVSVFLLPVFLLLTSYYPEISETFSLLSTEGMGPVRITFYLLAVEFLLDLFKYSSAHSPGRFSGSLSIVGGLIIGDVAVQLNWASNEVLFYAAVTLLTTLSLANVDFSEGLRIYRLFLIFMTAFLGPIGFWSGVVLMLISIATTPTLGGKSYLWPLFPFNWQALKTLLFRYPTAKSQPSKNWHKKA